jgi:tetratricopeptide (TPR) repeat protein
MRYRATQNLNSCSMPAVSSIFLVLAFILSVVIGTQTRPWAWGPAMLALGLSVLAALPVFWKRNKLGADFGLIAFGALVAAWFAWRTWTSPVAEFGQADMLLLSGIVATFCSLRAIQGDELAERILIWGIALMLLASLLIIGKQYLDRSFAPIFEGKRAGRYTGFQSHYNETANYLIASSMLVGAAALFGRHAMATRILWLLIAMAGITGVWFTGSRGGIFGAAIALGVLAVACVIIGKRKNARWFGPAIIALPLIGLGIGAFLLMGWQEAQELRSAGMGIAAGGEIDRLLDNTCRLFFLGGAMSCINLHPLSGGGSRSFSWEYFHFSDYKLHGNMTALTPEYVHNELVQAATDYGLIGAGLLICLLGALVVVAVVRLLFDDNLGESNSADAWRLGGLAALAGMFIQSCFSFVFHLLPGIILLGICLGQMSRASTKRGAVSQLLGSKILLSTSALACALLLIPMGWKGSQVTRILWPSYFSKVKISMEESKIDALTKAIQLWPQFNFYQERAALYQTMVGSATDATSMALAEQAINDYGEAERLHPYEAGLVVNRANTLSQLRRDVEAEEAYERAIYLQGGMELAFQVRFSFANHLLRKGLRQFSAEEPEPTLATMEIAAQQIEQSFSEMGWFTPDKLEVRVAIHESLGAAREANGDYKGAMQAYDFATTLKRGTRAHYRAGILYGKMAASAWSARRPAEALANFIKAKKRIGMTNELPQNVSQSQRNEYLAYLERTINFLKGAKISPAE